jgi:hypothetical protein
VAVFGALATSWPKPLSMDRPSGCCRRGGYGTDPCSGVIRGTMSLAASGKGRSWEPRRWPRELQWNLPVSWQNALILLFGKTRGARCEWCTTRP